MTRPTRLLIASAVAAVGLAAPAMAETTNYTTSDFSFRFAIDSDRVGSDAGAREIYSDLRDAAHDACRREAPSAQRTVNTQCRADLVASVVAAAAEPALSRVFETSAEYARLQEKTTQVASR